MTARMGRPPLEDVTKRRDQKVTAYLTRREKSAVLAIARDKNRSEADIVRQALALLIKDVQLTQ